MAGKALVLGIDAGGTMTDTFIVDEADQLDWICLRSV